MFDRALDTPLQIVFDMITDQDHSENVLCLFISLKFTKQDMQGVQTTRPKTNEKLERLY